MQNCAAIVATTPGVPVAEFQTFAATCVTVELQADAGE
jgi:hypothetical protein